MASPLGSLRRLRRSDLGVIGSRTATPAEVRRLACGRTTKKTLCPGCDVLQGDGITGGLQEGDGVVPCPFVTNDAAALNVGHLSTLLSVFVTIDLGWQGFVAKRNE